MSSKFTEDETFKGIDYTETSLIKGDYENCVFERCNFSKSDLSAVNFTDCEFEDCDISMANISNTAFRNVNFNKCKLLGLRFEACNEFLFSVAFESSQLNLSSFYKMVIKDTVFKACNLREVDFAAADLSAAVFANCDLAAAIFENTNLEKADFSTAENVVLNPDINKIRKAKFSIQGAIGLLAKYDIIVE
jgi:uncharacterized protein YjbI with pentapeptide repeats